MWGMKMLKIALLALVLTSPIAAAEPTPDALGPLLLGIDSVPTAAQLRAAAPDPEASLAAAARDTSLGLYPRQRAVSLLTVIGGERALAALTELATTGDDAVRAAAVYAVGRGFGATSPDAALAVLSPLLDAPLAAVRQSAARGLRWVDRPTEVRAALRSRAAREPEKTTRRIIEAALSRVEGGK